MADKDDYTLVGEARSGSPTMSFSLLHPEYRVDSRSGCCIDARVVFIRIPAVKPVHYTSTFPAWKAGTPLRDEGGHLARPPAWNEYTAEEKSAKNSVQDTCSPNLGPEKS